VLRAISDRAINFLLRSFGSQGEFFWEGTGEKGAVPTHRKILDPVKLPQEKIRSRKKDSAAQFEIDALQELGKDNKSFL
jgi:hypothetical protein